MRSWPRRAWAAIAIGAAAVIALSVGSRCALDVQPWNAGLDQYDYLQQLRLHEDGTGDYAFGYAQAVRFEARFRYRVLDEQLELRDFVEIDAEGGEHELDWPPQRIGYELREGRYCFTPPYGGESCYRCALTLGSTPLPGGYHDYYACPTD